MTGYAFDLVLAGEKPTAKLLMRRFPEASSSAATTALAAFFKDVLPAKVKDTREPSPPSEFQSAMLATWASAIEHAEALIEGRLAERISAIRVDQASNEATRASLESRRSKLEQDQLDFASHRKNLDALVAASVQDLVSERAISQSLRVQLRETEVSAAASLRNLATEHQAKVASLEKERVEAESGAANEVAKCRASEARAQALQAALDVLEERHAVLKEDRLRELEEAITRTRDAERAAHQHAIAELIRQVERLHAQVKALIADHRPARDTRSGVATRLAKRSGRSVSMRLRRGRLA
jgi:hypothetical protein